MKIVYDTPKKEFEPFSIRIETEDEAKVITSLIGGISMEILREITGKTDVYSLGNTIFSLFDSLEIEGYADERDLLIKYE